jgi:hypothetical protein
VRRLRLHEEGERRPRRHHHSPHHQKEQAMTTETWNNTVELGTPVYAIDANQNSISGTFSKRLPDGMVEILTKNGPRVFHAKFVVVDQWRRLEDLP